MRHSNTMAALCLLLLNTPAFAAPARTLKAGTESDAIVISRPEIQYNKSGEAVVQWSTCGRAVLNENGHFVGEAEPELKSEAPSNKASEEHAIRISRQTSDLLNRIQYESVMRGALASPKPASPTLKFTAPAIDILSRQKLERFNQLKSEKTGTGKDRLDLKP